MGITTLELFQRRYGNDHPAGFSATDEPVLKPTTIVNDTKFTSTCSLCRDCRFIGSAEFFRDLLAIRPSVPQDRCVNDYDVFSPNSSSKVTSSVLYGCNRATSQQECEVCGTEILIVPHSMSRAILAPIGHQEPSAPSQNQICVHVPL